MAKAPKKSGDPRVLENVDWDASRAQYDWATILDGQPRLLKRGAEGQEGEEGIDYTCSDLTFGTLARNAARRIGKSIRTKKHDEGTILQAYDATDEQKAQWAEQDEANKEKAKQRRQQKAAEKKAAASGTDTDSGVDEFEPVTDETESTEG